MLRRRAVTTSILGLGFGALAGRGARAAAAPQYWELVTPAIPVKALTGAYMIAGAAAGGRLVAGGEHGLIIYSDDQAKTWTQAKVPATTAITDIAFASPQVGWATGGFGLVLKTEDGGQSWVKQLDGIDEIKMMNATTQAYTATLPPDSDVTDHLNRRAQILTQEGPDKPFLCVLPLSETEIFAFGTYRFAEYSNDGGKTWTDWSMKIGDPVAVSHNIYGAAKLFGAIYLVSEVGLIYRSTDGGQTFPQLAQPGDATFFGICDAGKGNILAYGVAGEMYVSPDQGKSWNAVNFTGNSNINAVATMEDGSLIAGDSGGGIWQSKDNAASWALVVRNPVLQINDVLPVKGTRFLIMSEAGVFPFDLASAQGA